MDGMNGKDNPLMSSIMRDMENFETVTEYIKKAERIEGFFKEMGESVSKMCEAMTESDVKDASELLRQLESLLFGS